MPVIDGDALYITRVHDRKLNGYVRDAVGREGRTESISCLSINCTPNTWDSPLCLRSRSLIVTHKGLCRHMQLCSANDIKVSCTPFKRRRSRRGCRQLLEKSSHGRPPELTDKKTEVLYKHALHVVPRGLPLFQKA